MKYVKLLLSGILSGILISIGSIVFLMEKGESRFFGALLFAIGLFSIIQFKLFLYTGKVGFALDNKPSYLVDLVVGLIGNLIGAILMGLMMSLTRINASLYTNALEIVSAKESDTWYSLLFLSFMCGIMIYLAVKGHETCPYSIGKIAFVFGSICIFILCGFEHCIANAFYYTVAKVFNWHVVLSFVIMIIGNGLGSIFINEILKLINRSNPKRNPIV